jgi:hypothetical protein
MGTSAVPASTPVREGISPLPQSCRRWLLLIQVAVGVKRNADQREWPVGRSYNRVRNDEGTFEIHDFPVFSVTYERQLEL